MSTKILPVQQIALMANYMLNKNNQGLSLADIYFEEALKKDRLMYYSTGREIEADSFLVGCLCVLKDQNDIPFELLAGAMIFVNVWQVKKNQDLGMSKKEIHAEGQALLDEILLLEESTKEQAKNLSAMQFLKMIEDLEINSKSFKDYKHTFCSLLIDVCKMNAVQISNDFAELNIVN
ncbi:hypothetical protein [Acinetobacter sp. Leaf130]|uniref:hypothetical protein n=1 Tax=Acinetobacter sp. Leaf130 TaxID=1736269 RepID=UPI0006F31683|nr:hypothetical protein [Acinetobacter sp. Leaf130]KQQ65492.1 hypothetical protein ASF86_18610 [Acinetobacter sp. Leaf130]